MGWKNLCQMSIALKDTKSVKRCVSSLLKLDPTNVTLLAQKQELLTDTIADTKTKLTSLEKAQIDVEKTFNSGDIGKDKYLAFQREVEATRNTLKKYEMDLSSIGTEQDRLATNTQRLSKLFEATDKSVDEYADTLGTKLHSAIKNGTASSS
ncbi:MAG: hypothetical protein ACK5LV_11080 [Lachnospirales bacterium]